MVKAARVGARRKAYLLRLRLTGAGPPGVGTEVHGTRRTEALGFFVFFFFKMGGKS